MKINPWLEKSTKNLLAQSEAADFTVAQTEWKFTGAVIDHESPVETCELCEHEELRYHYEIENSKTLKSLWVGSSCILRFQDINIYDDLGNQITDEEERRKQLKKALREKLANLMLEPLRALWKIDKEYREYIMMSVNHFKVKNAFLPKPLAFLFARLKKYNIEYKPQIFPIYLRSDYSKQQFFDLENELLSLIAQSLSEPQRKKYQHFLNKT